MKQGYGTLNLSNGDQYQGQWSKDLPHGKGVYTFCGKSKLRGTFFYGEYKE